MVEVGTRRKADELATVAAQSSLQGVEGPTAAPPDLPQQLAQGAGGGEEIEAAIGGRADDDPSRIFLEQSAGAPEQVEVEVGNVRAHHHHRAALRQGLVEGEAESGPKAVAALETEAHIVGELERDRCRHFEAVAGATTGFQDGIETGAMETALETLA